jgi:hypothetical protein
MGSSKTKCRERARANAGGDAVHGTGVNFNATRCGFSQKWRRFGEKIWGEE